MDGPPGFADSLLQKVLFLPPQASSVAAEIDWLHFSVIALTMTGAMLITLVAMLFCVRYRRRGARVRNEWREAVPTPPLWVELGLVAGLFALFVAWWGVGYWQYVRLAEPPAGSYDVYVSAKQWMWKFAYPSGQHSIATLFVPVKRPVRLIMTSRDVIHSLFVPDFRIKHDVVPGRYTQLWFSVLAPGKHRIFCTEYCGTDHSRMLGEVVALAPADFERWQRANEGGGPADPELLSWSGLEPDLVERGRNLSGQYGCLRCHSLDGSPHIGPTWTGLFGARVPLQDGSSVLADAAYLTESMMEPLAKLHRGYASVMPSYVGYLKPGDVSAIVELIRSLEHSPERAPAPLPQPAGGVYRLPENPADTRAIETERQP